MRRAAEITVMQDAWRETGPAARLIAAARFGFVAVAALAFIVVTACSLTWHVSDDAALMLYIARVLVEGQRLPYVDVFDLHPPGALAAYAAAGQLFGFTLNGGRLADLACLMVLLGVVGWLLRPRGRLAAVAGVSLVGLLHTRAAYMLEREVLALTVVLPALALLVGWRRPRLAAGVCGVALLVAASIKPTLIIALAAIAVWLFARRREVAWRMAGVMAATFLAAALLLAAALSWLGLLERFLEIAVNYWPLYAAIDDGLGQTSGAVAALERAAAILATAHVQWLAPGMLAAWIAWQSEDDAVRDRVALLLLLAVAFLCYPVLGHGRSHEWLPFLYVVVPLSVLALRPLGGNAVSLSKASAFLLLVLVAGRLVWLPDKFVRQVAVGDPQAVEQKTILRVAERLRLHGGGTLTGQALEWMDGGATAMFVAGVEPATGFFYDLPFYHHASTPYVQKLRDRFIEEIAANPPAVIVRRNAPPGPIVAAPDNQRAFRRVDALLAHYEICYRTSELLLYHRRGVAFARDAHSD